VTDTIEFLESSPSSSVAAAVSRDSSRDDQKTGKLALLFCTEIDIP